jgi:hypothetical protein
MRTRIVMQERYTGCQHSTPFVLNGPKQFFLAFAIQLWRYFGPLLHEFHHQHSFLVSENICHQVTGKQTTFI